MFIICLCRFDIFVSSILVNLLLAWNSKRNTRKKISFVSFLLFSVQCCFFFVALNFPWFVSAFIYVVVFVVGYISIRWHVNGHRPYRLYRLSNAIQQRYGEIARTRTISKKFHAQFQPGIIVCISFCWLFVWYTAIYLCTFQPNSINWQNILFCLCSRLFHLFLFCFNWNWNDKWMIQI